MCIRDSNGAILLSENSSLFSPISQLNYEFYTDKNALATHCLLYTSDAADERSSVDLGGRRLIKKKKKERTGGHTDTTSWDDETTNS